VETALVATVPSHLVAYNDSVWAASPSSLTSSTQCWEWWCLHHVVSKALRKRINISVVVNHCHFSQSNQNESARCSRHHHPWRHICSHNKKVASPTFFHDKGKGAMEDHIILLWVQRGRVVLSRILHVRVIWRILICHCFYNREFPPLKPICTKKFYGASWRTSIPKVATKSRLAPTQQSGVNLFAVKREPILSHDSGNIILLQFSLPTLDIVWD